MSARQIGDRGAADRLEEAWQVGGPMDDSDPAGTPAAELGGGTGGAAGAAAAVPLRAEATGYGLRDVLRAVSPQNCSAVYVIAVLVLVFSLLAGDRFFNTNTILIVLNGAAVSGIVAVTLVIPMAAGVFDVSVGYVVALSGTLVAYLVASANMPGGLAIVVTLICGAAIALVNILVVVVMRINSFVGTLATGAIFLSMTTALSSQQSITKNVDRITGLLNLTFLRLSLPVWVLFGLTLLIWFVMRWTSFGRYCYAIGFAPEAARLAGLPVRTLQALALVCSGVSASIGGILLTARIGAGTPSSGPDYLLPAFAAVFVGMTQFERGRLNAPGTFAATILLATAANGLSVLGAPLWAPQLIQGVILVAAVATTVAQGSFRPSLRRRRTADNPANPVAEPQGTPVTEPTGQESM